MILTNTTVMSHLKITGKASLSVFQCTVSVYLSLIAPLCTGQGKEKNCRLAHMQRVIMPATPHELHCNIGYITQTAILP